jgi:hypothetical protein
VGLSSAGSRAAVGRAEAVQRRQQLDMAGISTVKVPSVAAPPQQCVALADKVVGSCKPAEVGHSL